VLAIIELSKSYTAVSVNKSLLINPANAFDGADIVSILRAKISRVFCFDLTMGFFLFFFAFQGNHLGLGKDQSVLGNTGFQGL
jgi:hypothetical protein